MSNPSNTAPHPGPFGFIRSPRDFWGGLGLLAIALIAWWASRELPGQQGFAFGPGTAPRLFMMLLGANAVLIAVQGLLLSGPAAERWNPRGVLFVLGGVMTFAATIRPLGLVISTIALVLISAAASRDTKWTETGIWAVVLAIFCAVLFPKVLNLPMQLWPTFLQNWLY